LRNNKIANNIGHLKKVFSEKEINSREDVISK
jgi:hypothetical protein